jgi:hypothetical protein
MEEDLTREEEVKTTPADESDSNDSELDALFAQDDDSQEAPVSREEFNALKKGVSKFFSDKGRQVKAKGEGDDKAPTTTNAVMRSLYFKSNPEAETVWKQVEQEAGKLNRDPFELYEGSAYFKGEAKTLFEQKNVEKENASKVGVPSSLVKGGKLSYEKIDLEKPDHIKWLKEKPERITEYNEWIKTNWKK